MRSQGFVMRVTPAFLLFCTELLLIYSTAPGAFAQSEPNAGSSKVFFEENYAQSVAGLADLKQVGPRGESRKQATQSRVDPQRAGKVPEGAQGERLGGAAAMGDDSKMPPIMRLPRVQLFVNSADSEHLRGVVSTAIAAHKAGRLLLLTVYHIGDYRTLTDDLRRELEALQVPYIATATVMYGEGVLRSPTWVFAALDGMRMVEGVMSPDRYLATHGLEPAPRNLDAMNKRGDELVGW